MKNTKYLVIVFIIILALVMTACGTEEEINIPEEDIEETVEKYEAADGGTLKLAVTRFNTLNPLFNKNYSLFQIHHLIYEGLVTFDENMEIKPLLAQDWNKSTDGQSLQLTLRQDVNWHDGKPFTAEDVIFTINLIKGNINGNSVFKGSLQQITDVREIQNGVINITFSKPFSNSLEVMTFPILPKHLFDGNDINKLKSPDFPLVGTGSYKLDNYETMRSIQLSRNDSYWGQKPYIEKIDITIVPDIEAQLMVFENGDIDLAQPTSIDWAKYTEKKNVNVHEYVSHNYEFLGFNFRKPIFRDSNIRKAIAYSIDRHKLINNIYLGHGTVVDAPIYPLASIYDESQLQYGYNTEKAIELLGDSGYTLNGENNLMLNENGVPLNLNLLVNNDNILREKTAFFIKEELEKIGIKLEVELLEWEEFNTRVNRGDFDILLGGWDLSYITDLSFAFHSSQVGGSNFIFYSNETMDELLETVIRAPNSTAKEEGYRQLQKHIIEELPYMSLFFKNGSIVVRNKVKGEFKPNNYNLFNGIEGWFINTK